MSMEMGKTSTLSDMKTALLIQVVEVDRWGIHEFGETDLVPIPPPLSIPSLPLYLLMFIQNQTLTQSAVQLIAKNRKYEWIQQFVTKFCNLVHLATSMIKKRISIDLCRHPNQFNVDCGCFSWYDCMIRVQTSHVPYFNQQNWCKYTELVSRRLLGTAASAGFAQSWSVSLHPHLHIVTYL